jgi:hypothetical protein
MTRLMGPDKSVDIALERGLTAGDGGRRPLANISGAGQRAPVHPNCTSFELVITAMRCICSTTAWCCSSVNAAQQSSSTTIS